jgi:hypothetical protein
MVPSRQRPTPRRIATPCPKGTIPDVAGCSSSGEAPTRFTGSDALPMQFSTSRSATARAPDLRLRVRLSRKSGCRPAGLRPFADGSALCCM